MELRLSCEKKEQDKRISFLKALSRATGGHFSCFIIFRMYQKRPEIVRIRTVLKRGAVCNKLKVSDLLFLHDCGSSNGCILNSPFSKCIFLCVMV